MHLTHLFANCSTDSLGSIPGVSHFAYLINFFTPLLMISPNPQQFPTNLSFYVIFKAQLEPEEHLALCALPILPPTSGRQVSSSVGAV